MVRHFIQRIQRLFGNTTEKPLLPSYDMLGFHPRTLDIYKLAFTHSSCGEQDEAGNKINNERLEFLGDSVLSTVISGQLYLKHPDWNEGQMSKRRSAIVKRAVNNAIGKRMNLGRYLRHGHEALDNSLSADVYGNTLEALIGAIYLDRGYKVAEQFIIQKVLPMFFELEDSLLDQTTNYKSLLLEWAQKHHLPLEFEMLQEPKRSGGTFISAVFIDGKKVGIGRGRNKKEAHQEAAHAALSSLNAIDPTISLTEE